MTNVLITGAYGQLGRAVRRLCESRGLHVSGHDLDTLDITDPVAVQRLVAELAPHTVINCAAFTAVDACEDDHERATEVNGTAVEHLVSACNRARALLVQVSTDYVFAGDGNRPYGEDDPVGPETAYGRSKLRGEMAARVARQHLIVRTAWLFGHGGANFVEAIRRQIDEGEETLRVVADQSGSPTYCEDLAEAILDLVSAGARGVVHAVNSGVTTWHGFATAVVAELGASAAVEPVTTAEVPRPAQRPVYSVLATDRLTSLLGAPLPPWRDALARYLHQPCAS